MKKNALIFLCSIFVSGAVYAKLIPRKYNAEATEKLQQKLDKELKSPQDITPVYLKSVDKLMQEGADPNIILKSDDSTKSVELIVVLATMPALGVDKDSVEQVVKSALSYGANPNAIEPESGGKAIFFAAIHGSLGMVKAFLDHGAVLDPSNEKDRAFINKLKEKLVDKKEWLDFMLRENINKENSIKEAEQLLKIVTSRTPKQHLKMITTYDEAATRKLQEMLNTMQSPRTTFSQPQVLKQVDALIKEGADPNITLVQTDDTITNVVIKMLVFSSFFNEEADSAQVESVLATALEHGANPNVYTNQNEPIIFHVAFTSPKMLELLLDYGADKDLKSKKGENVIDYVKNHIKTLKGKLDKNIKVTIPEMKQEINNLEKMVNLIEAKPEIKVQIK